MNQKEWNIFKSMKNLILMILLIFIINDLSSQDDLGLSKNDIKSKYLTCRIEEYDSSPYFLALYCDELIQFYSFNPDNGFCDFYGFEIPNSQLEKFKSQLLDKGYTLFANLNSYPIILVFEGGNKNTSTPATIYENKKFVISLLKYDLLGDESTNKVGVYAEYYKKEMFEKK